MFDWLRRLRQDETPEAVSAAVLRKLMRRDPPPGPSGPLDVGPSDGSADHHSGASHCDVAPCCDAGPSHH